jgi:hypothetical protein
VSPITDDTRSIGRPSTSAATCGMTVSVPELMSWNPASTTAVPSPLSRTPALDRMRTLPMQQSAMPWPTRQWPSALGLDRRSRQPNLSAPSSHVGTGEREPHRPPGDAGRRGRQDVVRPQALRAEPAAGVRADDADLLGLGPERGGGEGKDGERRRSGGRQSDLSRYSNRWHPQTDALWP